MRIPLEKDLAVGGGIGYGYTDPAKTKTAWGAHLVQQGTDAGRVGRPQDNSTLEVFTGGRTAATHTLRSWAGRHLAERHQELEGTRRQRRLTKLNRTSRNFAVTGGVERSNGHVVLAWTASNGKGSARRLRFREHEPRAVVEVDLGTNSVVREIQVWDDDYAFAYPSPAADAKDEVGMALGWGGKNDHANCAIGIMGDFVVRFPKRKHTHGEAFQATI